MRTRQHVFRLLLAGLPSVAACASPPREATADGRFQRDTAAGSVQQDSTRRSVNRDRRFSGYVRIRTTRGTDSVQVELLNLDLHDHTTVDRLDLPFEGSVIGYLVAGSAGVTIDGKRTERSQGQIWTVPPGAALGLATGRDAASLQLIVVERGRP